MITDALLTISGGYTFSGGVQTASGQAITADAYSTDTIDLSVARDIGEGESLYMVFTILQNFNTLTSLDLQVVTSANANLSSHTVINTVNVALADLTAGKQYVLKLPPRIGSLGQRYLGARYDVQGSNPTTGTILTQVVLDIQDGQKFYPRGDKP